MAGAHAVAKVVLLSEATGNLIRRDRGPVAPPAPPGHQAGPKDHPETGFPLIELREGTNMADIRRAVDDEDGRHLEVTELSTEEIQRALAR